MFDTGLTFPTTTGTESGDVMWASVDTAEQQLLAAEARIAQLRAYQLQLISQLDAAQVPLTDGTRTLGEWLIGRLDVAPETAAALVHLSRTSPNTRTELAEGTATFDRANATARLAQTDAPAAAIDASRGLDIPALRRLTARWRRLDTATETDTHQSRQLAIQPTLDNRHWHGWFRLPATDGQILETALHQRADQFPPDPDATRRQRLADALVSIAHDSLDGSDTGNGTASGPLLTVFADADIMASTHNEAGVHLPAGPQCGLNALEELLCAGSVEWIQRHSHGKPLAIGRRSRVIPPRLRRAIIARDGGCAADGCRSRYRLQVHHVTPWSQGGRTDPDNLICLCWYHHHIVVHGRGQAIDPDSPPGRIRFQPRSPRGPPI